MTTRVGINLLWLVPGEVGGSETWMVDLLAAVAADHPPDIEIVCFTTAAVDDAHPFIADSFATVRAPAVVGSSRPGRVLAESTWLAVAARRAKAAVLHHPGGTIPPVRATPAVLTVHDLQPLAFPEHFTAVNSLTAVTSRARRAEGPSRARR